MSGTDDDHGTWTLVDVGGSGVQAPQADDSGASQDGAPPAFGPRDPSGGERRPRPRWLAPVIVVLAAVALVAAGLVGWRLADSRRHDSALGSCSRAVEALREGPGQAARYREASNVKADQVKDARTVTAMRKAVGDAGGVRPRIVRCEASMSTSDLQAATDEAVGLGGEYRSLDMAAGAVLASRDAKSLDDAKAALDGKKDEAARLLGDSDGKVADNAARDGLQQAIDQAGQVKSDKAKAYQDAANALQSAMDQVNASMQQKSQADQAAAQAVQAQAAQQRSAQPVVPSYRPSYSRGGYAPSYGGGRGGYTPSYRPSYNRGGGGGSAPAPAAPAAPQGGGSNWRDRLKGNTTGGNGCNPDGSCGIG